MFQQASNSRAVSCTPSRGAVLSVNFADNSRVGHGVVRRAGVVVDPMRQRPAVGEIDGDHRGAFAHGIVRTDVDDATQS